MKLLKNLAYCCLLIIAHSLAADKMSLVVQVKPNRLEQPIKMALDLNNYQSFVLSSSNRMLAAFHLGYKQIQQALQAQGYFQAEVKGHIDYDSVNKIWHISYRVSPGKAVQIQSLELEAMGPGENEIKIQDILAQPSLKIGQTLQVSNYDKFKTYFQNAAISEGYFDSHYITHQIQINLAKHSATIKLSLETGKQYHYGTIQFYQNTFAPEFLQRFVAFKPGDPYNQDKIDQLQSNLASSGYFDSIAINPLPNPKSHEVPIQIKLTPKPAQEYQIGGGYGTDTGIRGLLGWKLRYIGKYGQYITAQLQAAKNYTNFSSSYVIPGDNPLTDYTSINLGRSYTDILPYSAVDSIAGLDRVKQYGKWTTDIGLTQHFIQASGPANPIFPAQRYLLPQATLSFSKFLPMGYYKQGIAWSIQAQGGSQRLLSSTRFAQTNIKIYGSLVLDQNDRVFIKANMGATAVNDLNNLSPLFRYYAGGVDSVRGYAYKSLGPTDANGNLIGGRYLATGNFNYEHKIWQNWSGVVFYDIGNAFNSINNVQWQKGAGLGTSWQSPVGTINFFIAHPVQPVQGPWRFDIGIETTL